MAELTPQFVQIVDELLEPAKVSGRMDVGTAFNSPLSARVIANLLGLPPEDQTRLAQWSYQLFAQALGAQKPENAEVLQYFSELFNERQRDPGNDLISALRASEENSTHLTREENIHMCLELMGAGQFALAMLLGFAFSRLCQHPEIYQALRDDPSLIPGAIEEIFRYDFSRVNALRTARHDTVFNGHEIKAGQYVVARLAAANFDERYFPHAEQFDMRRSPNPHLAFSYGAHYCVGAPLARLVGRIALERVVAHFSEIRLDPDNPKKHMEQMGSVALIESLGVLFTLAVP
jgi:cytochrome P450